MKFLISGGGTGGHINPALAIAKKIKMEYPNADILYVGTEQGLESNLVPKAGFRFKAIRVKGFRRKLSLDTLKSIKELLLGLNDARRVIKNFKPDVVIGTGGYVCGPVVLLGAMNRIPTLIHEQNALPGVTNKILSKFVDKIVVSFEESIKHFSHKEKVVLSGNPIRENFLSVNRHQAFNTLDLSATKDFVLSVGGSGGQTTLNDAMAEVIVKNQYNERIQLMHVTGKRHYEGFMKKLREKDMPTLPSHIRVVPYLFEMAEGFAAADIVITSSGAITIAEFTAIGVPTILIPKAYTAENHQEYNARALEKKGASRVVLEKELNGKILDEMIHKLLDDKDELKRMSAASKELAITDATDKILGTIKELIGH